MAAIGKHVEKHIIKLQHEGLVDPKLNALDASYEYLDDALFFKFATLSLPAKMRMVHKYLMSVLVERTLPCTGLLDPENIDMLKDIMKRMLIGKMKDVKDDESFERLLGTRACPYSSITIREGVQSMFENILYKRYERVSLEILESSKKEMDKASIPHDVQMMIYSRLFVG
jgi:hypothetical protein